MNKAQYQEKVAKKSTEVKAQTEVVRSEGDRPARNRRGVFNGQRQKLAVTSEIPGFRLAWVNDSVGRIHDAQEGGYDFVTQEEIGLEYNNVTSRNSDMGTKVSTTVGINEDGTPLIAYLMKIHQEHYEEDFNESQAYLDRIDSAIKGGNIEGQVGRDGRYVPKEGIKIK